MRGDAQLQERSVRTLPHVLDTLLLLSAVGMLVQWGVYPWEADWLLAKITALIVYILLGMVALRFGKRLRVKVVSWVLAMLTALYMITVAFTKNPLGPLVMMSDSGWL